jgi:Kinesin motor domain
MRIPRRPSKSVCIPVLSYAETTCKLTLYLAVRVRPPSKPEDPGYDLVPQRFRGSRCHVPTPTTLTVQSAQGTKLFVFDRVFGEDVDQEGVWEYLSESVGSFVQGYNVSILAYGQSGAGKSYTMGTTGPAEQSNAQLMGPYLYFISVSIHLTSPSRNCSKSSGGPFRKTFSRFWEIWYKVS